MAIKVLLSSFSADADRLRPFEQEARAAGILNHPNITAVYDIGTHEAAPYVVQELLEGETLPGRREPWKRLSPEDSTGIIRVNPRRRRPRRPVLCASDLYVLEGVR